MDLSFFNLGVFGASRHAGETRREDLLFPKHIIDKLWILRHYLGGMNSLEAMEFMKTRLMRSNSMEEFLASMNDE